MTGGTTSGLGRVVVGAGRVVAGRVVVGAGVVGGVVGGAAVVTGAGAVVVGAASGCDDDPHPATSRAVKVPTTRLVCLIGSWTLSR
jgi:hypothetical protein